MNSFWDRLGHGFAVLSSYNCALSKSLNFTYFGSKITLVLFDNTLHSEVCIVFYRFPEEVFFLFSKITFEYAGLVHTPYSKMAANKSFFLFAC